MNRVLLALCVKPGMNAVLNARAYQLASQVADHNPNVEISVMFYHGPIARMEADKTPWARVARARNQMIWKIDLRGFDYVLSVDADVVDYPLDMPSRMIKHNPKGITAPLVLVEDTTRFYDTAAFIEHGKETIEPELNQPLPGRNLQHDPPYWSVEPTERLVAMDCVGTVVMYPVPILAGFACPPRGPFLDHPAFTDHYRLCRYARAIGCSVIVDRKLVALHANLPSYGESWH